MFGKEVKLECCMEQRRKHHFKCSLQNNASLLVVILLTRLMFSVCFFFCYCMLTYRYCIIFLFLTSNNASLFTANVIACQTALEKHGS